ncbi:hypothetical protein, partial [Staphylococcus aureus]
TFNSVLTEALNLAATLSASEHLCQCVMTVEHPDSEKRIEWLDNLWDGFQECTERLGYGVYMSKRIPF